MGKGKYEIATQMAINPLSPFMEAYERVWRPLDREIHLRYERAAERLDRTSNNARYFPALGFAMGGAFGFLLTGTNFHNLLGSMAVPTSVYSLIGISSPGDTRINTSFAGEASMRNRVLENLLDMQRAARLPFFAGGIVLAAKSISELGIGIFGDSNTVGEGLRSLAQAVSSFSMASGMYLNEDTPRALNKPPVWETIGGWFRSPPVPYLKPGQ